MNSHAERPARSAAIHAAHFCIGFLSRPCCSIPAALALLGAGGTGIAAAIAPYWLWFMLAAAVFFSASFYWNFIRNRNRAGMVVWFLSVTLAAGLWTFPLLGSDSRTPFDIATSIDRNLMTTTFKIDGMACQACVRKVERTVKKLGGVHDATVSLEQKRAVVAFDPTQIEVEAISRSIREAGFIPVTFDATE